jgi:hypothetical protein
VYEFGHSGFGWRLAHRTAVAAGLFTGLLLLAYGVMLVLYSAMHQYAGVAFGYMGGPGGFDFSGMQAPSCLLAAAVSLGLTALASRPGRPSDPTEQRELRRAMVLLDDLQSRLGRLGPSISNASPTRDVSRIP